MSASLAVICHQLDANTDRTTSQLLNGITSMGVEACVYSSQEVVTNIDDFEQFSGFIFEASTVRFLDKIVEAFHSAALLRQEAGLWRNKLAAGFTKDLQSKPNSLRAMMDFSFFCNSQNMIWLSSGINVNDIPEEPQLHGTSLGNTPVLEEMICQAFRHGQYLANVAQRWQPDN